MCVGGVREINKKHLISEARKIEQIQEKEQSSYAYITKIKNKNWKNLKKKKMK